MKYLSLFILALILCAVMALNFVLPGVTAYKEGEIDRVADLRRDNNLSNSRYFVNGYRQGRVMVKHAMTAEVIRVFSMDYGVVVRETFLLDGGKTVAASQKDHTVFWDFETSREIRRFPQRIYGFSHDGTKFFTLKSLAEGSLLLYAYPSLTSICELIPEASGGGIMNFSLAPNDRFLNVMFAPNYPESDENYPQGDPSARTVLTVNLFNLETCQEIKEFTQAFGPFADIGIFSPDSNFLDLERAYFSRPGSSDSEVGSWRFNLKTYQVEKIN
jgi:WD40 repeat protein